MTLPNLAVLFKGQCLAYPCRTYLPTTLLTQAPYHQARVPAWFESTRAWTVAPLLCVLDFPLRAVGRTGAGRRRTERAPTFSIAARATARAHLTWFILHTGRFICQRIPIHSLHVCAHFAVLPPTAVPPPLPSCACRTHNFLPFSRCLVGYAAFLHTAYYPTMPGHRGFARWARGTGSFTPPLDATPPP